MKSQIVTANLDITACDIKIADKRRAWRKRLFDAQGGRCIWCAKPMSLIARKTAPSRAGQPARDFATFEHLVPRRDGGRKADPNIALAHYKCNRRREGVKMRRTLEVAIGDLKTNPR